MHPAKKMDDQKIQDPKLIFQLNSNAADVAVSI